MPSQLLSTSLVADVDKDLSTKSLASTSAHFFVEKLQLLVHLKLIPMVWFG